MKRLVAWLIAACFLAACSFPVYIPIRQLTGPQSAGNLCEEIGQDCLRPGEGGSQQSLEFEAYLSQMSWHVSSTPGRQECSISGGPTNTTHDERAQPRSDRAVQKRTVRK